MKVTSFYGKHISSVLSRIREEHGDDAIILESLDHPTKGYEIKVGLDSDKPSSGVETLLIEHGVDTESREKLLHIPQNFKGEDLIAHNISQSISFESRLPFKSRVISLIGPTGVGKTTTIAKIAAQLKNVCNISVGFVSLDSFRVGAEQQLKIYADLLGIPFRHISADRPIVEEFQKALHALRLCDVILVDTAGCSPHDRERIKLLSCSVKQIKNIERILVLAAPTNEHDMKNAADSFKKVGYSRIIITKIDETGHLGPAINTMMKLKKKVSFFTTGQRVPEDIEPASALRLSWMLREKRH